MTMLQTRNTSDTQWGPTIGIGREEIMIYSWVVYSVACQLINIFGIVTNTLNCVCFVKQGFQDPVNISLLGLSISDLAGLAVVTVSCIFIPCDVNSIDLPFEILDVTYLMSATPHFAFTRVSSCITAMITFERCLSIAVPLKIKDIITPKRTAVVIVLIFITFTCSAAPVYVASRLGTYFSEIKNKTTYGIVYRDPREQIERITLSVNNFIIPFGAFIIIGVCTVILSIQLRVMSKWRNTNVTSKQADKVSNRNQKVAKMVVLISVLYIACFVPTSVMIFAMAFESALFINGKYMNITIALFGLIYVLEGTNSSMNIFIYFHMSSKYRNTFNRLFGC